MNAIVIEHVPVAELPPAWRARLALISEARVTVRIEAEGDSAVAQGAAEFADDPLFGVWRDRQDMVDVAGYIRAIGAPRFSAQTGGDTAAGSTTGSGWLGRVLVVLIDSDVLVWLTRGNLLAAQRLNEIAPWWISVVTYIELAQGCRDKAELARLKQGLAAR
jgi:hypothetical protein